MSTSAQIIRMPIATNAVPPKSTSNKFNNQRYTLQYDPLASVDARWRIHVSFTQTYDFYDTAPDERAARRKAEKLILSLTDRARKSSA